MARRRARARHIRLSYSMTSSARARIDGGTVRPRALAVLRLTTSSNFVGCWTGRSAGLSPARNSTNIGPGLAPSLGEAASIADQAACLRELAPLIDRRNAMTCGQRHQLIAPTKEELVAADDEHPRLLLGERRQGGLDIRFRCRPSGSRDLAPWYAPLPA